jgi:acetyl esterase/lipase
MGSSAGGNLAMLAAYTTGDPELPPSCEVPPVAVRSVVNLYGPADLVLFYDSSDSLAWVRSILETYIGGPPARFPERYRAVSPIRHVGAGTPPTLTLLGESDRIVPRDQALALDRALAAAGIAHETYLLPVTYHLFDMNWGGFATQFARAKIEAFLMR